MMPPMTRRHFLRRCAGASTGLAALLAALPSAAQELLKTRPVKLPWQLRQVVAGAEEMLRFQGREVLAAGGKPLLRGWLAKKKPPPGILQNGRLLALLVPPDRPDLARLVTVRTVENMTAADFSTAELERADRIMLHLLARMGEWRSLESRAALARLNETDSVWQELPKDCEGIALYQFEGEWVLLIITDQQTKDGFRLVLPERVRGILKL